MKVLLHVNYYEGAGKFETLFKLIRSVGADGVELRAKNYYNMTKEQYWTMVEELKQRNPDLELAFGYPLHFSSVDKDTQKQEFDKYLNKIINELLNDIKKDNPEKFEKTAQKRNNLIKELFDNDKDNMFWFNMIKE